MFIECCIRNSVCKGLVRVREVRTSHINDADEMNVVSRERQKSSYLLLLAGVMNISDFISLTQQRERSAESLQL